MSAEAVRIAKAHALPPADDPHGRLRALAPASAFARQLEHYGEVAELGKSLRALAAARARLTYEAAVAAGADAPLRSVQALRAAVAQRAAEPGSRAADIATYAAVRSVARWAEIAQGILPRVTREQAEAEAALERERGRAAETLITLRLQQQKLHA